MFWLMSCWSLITLAIRYFPALGTQVIWAQGMGWVRIGRVRPSGVRFTSWDCSRGKVANGGICSSESYTSASSHCLIWFQCFTSSSRNQTPLVLFYCNRRRVDNLIGIIYFIVDIAYTCDVQNGVYLTVLINDIYYFNCLLKIFI